MEIKKGQVWECLIDYKAWKKGKQYISIKDNFLQDDLSDNVQVTNSSFIREYFKLVENKPQQLFGITSDKVVQSVMNDLNERSKVGLNKYNTTLERTDLELKDWLQHAYEETLDKANYLKRAILELKK